MHRLRNNIIRLVLLSLLSLANSFCLGSWCMEFKNKHEVKPENVPEVNRRDKIENLVQQLDKTLASTECRYNVSEVFDRASYLLKYELPDNFDVKDLVVKVKYRVISVRGSQGLDDVQVLPRAVNSQKLYPFWTVKGNVLKIVFRYQRIPKAERQKTCSAVDENIITIDELKDDYNNHFILESLP